MITVHNHRVNAAQRAVYDVHYCGRFTATVEVIIEPVGGRVGLKVLIGAIQPKGKKLALEAICKDVAETSNV